MKVTSISLPEHLKLAAMQRAKERYESLAAFIRYLIIQDADRRDFRCGDCGGRDHFTHYHEKGAYTQHCASCNQLIPPGQVDATGTEG